MILPASEETFFNTKFVRPSQSLCAYDMLFHPPDYNPRAKRNDRTEPRIIWNNIWEQEKDKIVPSTTYLQYGRPTLPILDNTRRLYPRVVMKDLKPDTRLYNVIEWVVPLVEEKPTTCA